MLCRVERTSTITAAGRLEPGRCASQQPAASGPVRILHLEDSPSDAALAQEFLRADGLSFTVQRVETRQQFGAALEAGGADLVIADYHLPDFDGLAAFELVRQHCPETPFIMLTGKLGEEYAVDSLKFGVTDYVLKQIGRAHV
jgi:DNA-binding response OmpR family regulator